MDDLNAEMEVLQNLAARTPKLTAIDDLPLEREEPVERRHASEEFSDRFDGLHTKNQYFQGEGASDTRSDTRELSNEFHASQYPRFSRVSESHVGVPPFSLQSDAVFRGRDFSGVESRM